MKLLLSGVTLLGLFVYLIVIDLGINAGRVHHGVSVPGIDLGGMTEAEAVPKLEALGETMESAPILFVTPGFDCRFAPSELGWGPQPFDTFEEAMEVGRSGGWLRSLRDRARSWFGGVEASWAGSVREKRLDRWLDRCEELATGMGVELDRERLRQRVLRLVETWPRDQVYQLPLS